MSENIKVGVGLNLGKGANSVGFFPSVSAPFSINMDLGAKVGLPPVSLSLFLWLSLLLLLLVTYGETQPRRSAIRTLLSNRFLRQRVAWGHLSRTRLLCRRRATSSL